MNRYIIGILFCLILAMAYPAFRMEVTEELRHRKIRKRDIRQKQKGIMNFWFYTELEKEYGLGKYGTLLRLYPIVAGTFTALHIPFGRVEALALPDLILATATALYLSVIILSACINRNRRLFGKPFILWGWQRVKNVGSRRFEVRKDGTYLQHYSTLFDLILSASPLVFPLMMGMFEGNGW
ncbi:MAG: hypothetical protein IKU90_01715 [Clostridia bacterium]|nr:hypothetical protein [Clostridia bacterium]